ncbi:HpcH/HpaI aldolase/citrate lyase family protein [Oceanotoga teriensis]|uniref:HpcH/HpaI aldolase/citrate lyase family protein n=1 Tax=Oceanotoga teriensis TaxID=515440 RepID=UPI0027123074|nr:aldolase/citrate lyase family protein [Oceanotoga teriensis]MDO7975848.1 aldolase/citrate lyase family protein [Oceanotoga teriensis]
MKSIFFVPANNKKFLNNIKKLNADFFVIDLEDSILEKEYEKSIKNIKDFFNNNVINKEIFIRIDSKYYEKQIGDTQELNISGYMIPKVEDALISQYINYVNYNFKLIPLIESIEGLMNIENIINTSKNVLGIGLGGEDYCLDFECERTSKNLYYPRIKILNYSKLNNLLSFDTIYPFYNDKEGFKKELKDSISMGFEGKMLIHPDQLECFNNIKKEKLLEIKTIIELFEENSKKGKSILKCNGRIYERTHINKYKEIVKRGF